MAAKKNKKNTKDLGAQLAAAFEQSMYHLTLLGHYLPKVAEGLTPQQLRLLTVLRLTNEPITMAKAAATVGVKPGTLTVAVKRLVKLGLVMRARAEDDDRFVKLFLSPAGLNVMTEISNSRIQLFQEVCSSLEDSICRELIASHQFIAKTYREIVQQKKGGES